MQRAHRCLARWAKTVRAWEIWTLPRWLGAVVASVVLGYAAAVGVAASMFRPTVSDVTLFALLVGCIIVTGELTRQVGENKGLIKDVYGAWALPAAFLLPPVVAVVGLLRTRGRHSCQSAGARGSGV